MSEQHSERFGLKWEERRGTTTYTATQGYGSWVLLTRSLSNLIANDRVTKIISGWQPNGEITFEMLKQINPEVEAKQ